MAERLHFMLVCTTCKWQNYNFSRGKKKETKVEVKKFCPGCGKHTAHKESKVSS